MWNESVRINIYYNTDFQVSKTQFLASEKTENKFISFPKTEIQFQNLSTQVARAGDHFKVSKNLNLEQFDTNFAVFRCQNCILDNSKSESITVDIAYCRFLHIMELTIE